LSKDEAVVLSLSLKRYWRDENAATAIEYGLICGMIAVVVIGISATGGSLSSLYDRLQDIASGLGGGGGDPDGG
jgi:pilus assembly protein Flp/PilA